MMKGYVWKEGTAPEAEADGAYWRETCSLFNMLPG